MFDLNLLKQDYPNNLDRPYNAVIIIGRMKYEGEVQEIQNDEFGYFKFLGAYPDPLPDKIDDNPICINMQSISWLIGGMAFR